MTLWTLSDEVLLKRRGILFVVSAPSGTGKTTLVDQLVEETSGLVRSRSYTSRKPRLQESNQIDYNFITDEEFRGKVKDGLFLEWAEVFGKLYGTSAADVEAQLTSGSDVVLVIDVQGAHQVRHSDLNVVTIFILPPSMAVLKDRLSSRDSLDGDVTVGNQRLEAARHEVEASSGYDYIVVNNEYQPCLDRLRSIVIASRSGVRAMDTQRSSIVATFRLQDESEADK